MADEEDTSRFSLQLPRERPRRDSEVRAACLVVMYGESIGRRVTLGTTAVTVGRAAECDVRFEEESVSRMHCRLDPSVGTNGAVESWWVTDLSSTNGTHVNDRPVDGAQLRHGDHVQVGRNILKFLESGHIESAYHEEIHRLMTTDGLTNLPNRRAFSDALARDYSRAVRYQRPLSILAIDLDHFKVLNDRHGHLAGDAALRQFAATMRANLRRDDIAGRMGGEEFAVLLPEIDAAGARAAAEKLRAVIARQRFEFDDATIAITISIGVASRDEHDRDAMDIYRRADERLYAAKRAGRNRVED